MYPFKLSVSFLVATTYISGTKIVKLYQLIPVPSKDRMNAAGQRGVARFSGRIRTQRISRNFFETGHLTHMTQGRGGIAFPPAFAENT